MNKEDGGFRHGVNCFHTRPIKYTTVQNPTANYLVGIDLGTTHTVVAYAKADNAHQEIQIFQIEQLVAPGQVAARPLLPSVRYHPASGELSEADLSFPSGAPS